MGTWGQCMISPSQSPASDHWHQPIRRRGRNCVTHSHSHTFGLILLIFSIECSLPPLSSKLFPISLGARSCIAMSACRMDFVAAFPPFVAKLIVRRILYFYPAFLLMSTFWIKLQLYLQFVQARQCVSADFAAIVSILTHASNTFLSKIEFDNRNEGFCNGGSLEYERGSSRYNWSSLCRFWTGFRHWVMELVMLIKHFARGPAVAM